MSGSSYMISHINANKWFLYNFRTNATFIISPFVAITMNRNNIFNSDSIDVSTSYVKIKIMTTFK